MRVSICAVIAVRNEYAYLSILLPVLAEQNIDVVIIDNDSTDSSDNLYQNHIDNSVIAVEKLPYDGQFSLSDQLKKKEEIYNRLEYDWLVHHDADEILEDYRPNMTLRDAIQDADNQGYNVLNFEEFTFIPEAGEDYAGRNYYQELLRYYFFEKHKNFLNRAWKRSSRLSNGHLGGHILKGENVRIYPHNHVLRHYIALSEKRAKDKYLKRVFDEAELIKGWHRDRVNLSRDSLVFPIKSDFLFSLDAFDKKDFTRRNPARDHYWYWGI